MTLAIYIASKTRHAPRWRELRAAGVPIVASWIDEPEVSDDELAVLWERCIREAATATGLVVYCEPGDRLHGALAEVGAALARGVPVVWVGPPSDTLHWHPAIRSCDSVEEAMTLLGVDR